MLGLDVRKSKLNSPNHTCIGGETFLSDEEKYPVCASCKKDLTLILQLNHDVLPLKGSMYSTGISRVFMCNNFECPCLIYKMPHYIILQSDKELHNYKPGWSSYQEQTIDSVKVYQPGSSRLKACSLQIKTDDYHETTHITLDISTLEDIKYLNWDGEVTIMDKIYLEDNKRGLKLAGIRNHVAPTVKEIFPIK
jgi:hypothetical protein